MANTKDIIIKQGANFKMVIDYRNPDNTGFDLTGYTFRMMIKDGPGGTMIYDASANVTRDTSVAGRVRVDIPSTATSSMNFVRGVYDILAVASNGSRTRLLQGGAIFSPGVTT